jgi:hypothetical protein
MDDILGYQGIGPDGQVHDYCEECALYWLFGGSPLLLQMAKEGKVFDDASGHAFLWLTENMVQYEQYPGELLSLDGVFCFACGAELYPPFDLPF